MTSRSRAALALAAAVLIGAAIYVSTARRTEQPAGVGELLYPSLEGMTDQEIDKVTHLNAMRVFDYDPFSILGGRDKCTVGALRARAADVDVSERAITHTPPRDPNEPPITILSIMEAVAKSGTQA